MAQKRIQRIFIFCLGFIFVTSLVIAKFGFSNHQKLSQSAKSEQLNFDEIGNYVAQDYNVLVKIGADWCLTCSYNDFVVFDNSTTEDIYKKYNIKLINIDWTDYKPAILNFMEEYGRKGIPFYILYNKNIPEGLVLPEILSQMEFEKILNNNAVIPTPISEEATEK